MAHRNFLQFLRLLSMDTDSSRFSREVEKIQRQASWLGFYEAFLEAGPQFVLQMAIVMRFGYVSKYYICLNLYTVLYRRMSVCLCLSLSLSVMGLRARRLD